jgi:hypothetical protein
VIEFPSPLVGEGLGVRGFVDPWPFHDEDWKAWEAISRRYVEAVFAEDYVIADSISREMYDKMIEMERKYGEHPWILEHKADFTENPEEKLALYWRALELAVKHRHSTLTIRMWLADLLLDEFDLPNEAMEVLTDGQHELFDVDQDKDWIRHYEETLERIQKRLNK